MTDFCSQIRENWNAFKSFARHLARSAVWTSPLEVSPRRRPRKSDRVTGIENLEERLVPTGLSDLVPTLVQFSPTAPGATTTVHTVIQDLRQGSVKSFQVEYRLSSDTTIDDQDILIKTVTRKHLAAGGTSDWNQRITLPKDLPAGHYYLGVIADPKHLIPEQNETNNTLATESSVPVFGTSLTGKVHFENSQRPVSIQSLPGAGTPIDPAITTWIIIHGRNESAQDPDIVQLANAIDGYQPGDQVLLLNWSKAAASGALGGNGENYIKPVAAWAATVLEQYGFSGKQLNLVGYSWGSYVAAEMSEQIGTVNSLLSIEAAKDYPGGSYNPEAPGEVNFAAHADHSWAFFDAADFFGSGTTSATAQESFLTEGSDHFKAVALVTEILNSPRASPAASAIPLSRLLTGTPTALWPAKSYDATGKLVDQGATFDAVIQTTADGQHGESLRYFDGVQEQTVGI
ncbi:MAG: Hemolysin-type calcium-binding repeat family protein [Planctomycetaceae bacterium]|nr:Hemolysin-type calcium-binding repeat family protein [Planctomycetaceae bacterium]